MLRDVDISRESAATEDELRDREFQVTKCRLHEPPRFYFSKMINISVCDKDFVGRQSGVHIMENRQHHPP